MTTFIPLAHTAKSIEAVMTSHGFGCPTKDEVTLRGEKLPRIEDCPLTEFQHEVIKRFWDEFEIALESSPETCGLMRAIKYENGKSMFDPFNGVEYFEFCIGKRIDFEMPGQKQIIVSNLMRLTSFCFHAFLSGVNKKLLLENSDSQDLALIERATQDVAEGINTAHMYSFGMVSLIDELVESDYRFALGKENILYKQVNDFFRYYSYVSSAIEGELKRHLLRTPEDRSFSVDTFSRLPNDFNPKCFAIIDGDPPKLAIDEEIIEKIEKMDYPTNASRRACPAIYTGVLPRYLNWTAEIFKRFHWKEAD